MSRWLLLLMLGLPLAASGQQSADMHPYLGNTFFALVGLFRPDQRMRLGLEGSVEIPESAPAPFLDFSQNFGLTGSDDSIAAEIGWRFSDNWQLRGQYFRVDSTSRVTLEQDIEWGDYEYSAGTAVEAASDMQITRLFFGRTFRSSESHEFGLGIGAHILNLEALVAGNATIDGAEIGFRQERASIAQPLPNFGAWWVYGLSKHWAANVRFDWLSASVGKYDGRIVNSAASLTYAVGEHAGVSLAYNYFELALDIDDTSWRGRAKIRFNGPYLALIGYW